MLGRFLTTSCDHIAVALRNKAGNLTSSFQTASDGWMSSRVRNSHASPSKLRLLTDLRFWNGRILRRTACCVFSPLQRKLITLSHWLHALAYLTMRVNSSQ